MSSNDGPAERVWQPRFYAVCAVSALLLTGVLLTTGSGGWWGGFGVGYAVASVFALVFLAVQHYSLAGSREGTYAEQ